MSCNNCSGCPKRPEKCIYGEGNDPNNLLTVINGQYNVGLPAGKTFACIETVTLDLAPSTPTTIPSTLADYGIIKIIRTDTGDIMTGDLSELAVGGGISLTHTISGVTLPLSITVVGM